MDAIAQRLPQCAGESFVLVDELQVGRDDDSRGRGRAADRRRRGGRNQRGEDDPTRHLSILLPIGGRDNCRSCRGRGAAFAGRSQLRRQKGDFGLRSVMTAASLMAIGCSPGGLPHEMASREQIVQAAQSCGLPDFQPTVAGDFHAAYVPRSTPDAVAKEECIYSELKGQGLSVTR